MKKIDGLLKKVELFEKLAIHGDRESLLTVIAQEWTGGDPFTKEVYDPKAGSYDDNGQWHGGNPNTKMKFDPNAGSFNKNPQPSKSQNVQTLKETVVDGPFKIDPTIQDMLNRLLDGKIVPLLTDGVLGKNTRDALKLFKDTFKQPATVAAIKQEFNKLNQPSAVATTPSSGLIVNPNSGNPVYMNFPKPYANTKRTSPGLSGNEKKVPGPKT